MIREKKAHDPSVQDADGYGHAFVSEPSTTPVSSGIRHNRRSARILLALALVWLLFLIYPVIELTQLGQEPLKLAAGAVGLVLIAAAFGWAVWRGVTAPTPRPSWLALVVLVALSLVPPLVYGAGWFGGFVYVGFAVALTLPFRRAVAASVLTELVTAVVAVIARVPWWETASILLVLGLGCLAVLGIRLLASAYEELRLAQARIARLAASEERLRIARDLHDSVKQQAFVTSLEIGAARALIERDQQRAATHLDEAEVTIRQVQTELNAIIHEMQLPAPESAALARTIRDYAEDWSRRSHIPLEVRIREEPDIDPVIGQTLFLVAREALTNVARHSGATEASLEIELSDTRATLRVRDNGRGFDPSRAAEEGFGLTSMRERIQALGGHLSVESEPGHGTRITAVCLPLRSEVEP